MKKILVEIVMVCVLMAASTVWADSILEPILHQRAEEVAAAWEGGLADRLNQAVMDLMTAEARLLAVGVSHETSYLARVPKSVQDSNDSIGAYVWLIIKEKNTSVLWPKDFFAGREFNFACKLNK